jgi:hypothetical protein
MEEIGGRLLRLFHDVRRQGRLQCDGVDFDAYSLDSRYSVLNLGPLHLGQATSSTSTSVHPADPTVWSNLQINAVEVVYDMAANATEITVANTFWMLEGYSELKRRLELNLFAGTELGLSEDIYDSQIGSSGFQDSGEDNAEESSTQGGETTEEGTTTAGATTTAAGTTTPGATTTAVPRECPAASWCLEECPYEVRCDFPGSPDDSCGTEGTTVWVNGGTGCSWEVARDETGLAGGPLTCMVGGTWAAYGGLYVQPASARSCPIGLYSYNGTNPDCPSEITIYS